MNKKYNCPECGKKMNEYEISYRKKGSRKTDFVSTNEWGCEDCDLYLNKV